MVGLPNRNLFPSRLPDQANLQCTEGALRLAYRITSRTPGLSTSEGIRSGGTSGTCQDEGAPRAFLASTIEWEAIESDFLS